MSMEDEFTTFDEMVLTGALAEIEATEEIRERMRRLKGEFALRAERGDVGEVEEPEEE